MKRNYGTTEGLDTESRYVEKGRGGIALHLLGWEQRWVPTTGFYVDPESDEEREEEIPGEGEMVDDTDSGRVVVVMVGDDRCFSVILADLVKLGDLDYCTECGQVGCSHDGRDRGES